MQDSSSIDNESLQEGIDGLRQLTPDEARDLIRKGLDVASLEAAGFRRSEFTASMSEFEAFLAAADYETNYPSYLEVFRKAYQTVSGRPSMVVRKQFEQFLCWRLTKPGPEDVVMDVAAAHGTLSRLLKRLCNVKTSFHQDLTDIPVRAYPYLDSDEIELVKSNATELPVRKSSLSYMYLLNSWEHFQAPSDLGILKEAERCLKKAGKLVIVPLNVAGAAFVETDPDLWKIKQVYVSGRLPLFRVDVPVHPVKNGQTYGQMHDARLLARFAAQTPKLRYEIMTVTLDTQVEWLPERRWLLLIAKKV